jgi:hypothetical protein
MRFIILSFLIFCIWGQTLTLYAECPKMSVPPKPTLEQIYEDIFNSMKEMAELQAIIEFNKIKITQLQTKVDILQRQIQRDTIQKYDPSITVVRILPPGFSIFGEKSFRKPLDK